MDCLRLDPTGFIKRAFRLPPNERRRLLARFTYDYGADWPLDRRVNAVGEGAALTDNAFEPVSSNRSLRCGETEFSGQRQRGRNGLGDQGRRCRDKISQNPANSGLIAGFGVISVRTRMRGGGCSRYRTGLFPQIPW